MQRQREQEERISALQAAINFDKAQEEEKAVEMEDVRRDSKASKVSCDFETI